jgi:hypothetical protein
MKVHSHSEILISTQEAVRLAEARIRFLIEQAAATEATDIRIVRQAKIKIAESRALLVQVEERLRWKLGPSDPLGSIEGPVCGGQKQHVAAP